MEDPTIAIGGLEGDSLLQVQLPLLVDELLVIDPFADVSVVVCELVRDSTPSGFVTVRVFVSSVVDRPSSKDVIVTFFSVTVLEPSLDSTVSRMIVLPIEGGAAGGGPNPARR